MVSWNDTLYTGFLDLDWHGDPTIDFGAYLTGDTVWHALPAQPDGAVLFSAMNGRLFMGGNANELDNMPFPGVCEVIGGQLVPLAGNPMDGADIWAFEHWHDSYYFGGQITPFLGSRNIVAFDGGDQWMPLAQGIGGNHINSIRGFGDSLYVGGFFPPGPNVQSKHIQIWDGEAWYPFFPEVEFTSQVFDMEVYEDALWICGNFQFNPNGPVYAILRYDGHNLCAIGGPCPSGDNGGIAFFQNELYMAVGYGFPGLEFQRIARLPLDGLVPDECVEVTTSTAEYSSDKRITPYPCPAQDFINLRIPDLKGRAQVALRDALGRAAEVPMTTSGDVLSLDLTGLASGCYSVDVTDRSGKCIGRFIKQ
jgi:hypothetical protein